MVREIWLVSRELGGWAEAGGIKDVVRDQALAFPQIGWTTHVVLPLYGFLRPVVEQRGTLVWSGRSQHPTLKVPVEAWKVQDGNHCLHFILSPHFADKNSLYTYSSADEATNPQKVRGEGFLDSFAMNLEFQWAVVSYWWSEEKKPAFVLGHDGHVGFLSTIARTGSGFGDWFSGTVFGLLIHNAGPGYRQEMPVTAENEALMGLSPEEVKGCILDHHYDPMVSAARHSRLATVSENYATELKTGVNDHWSGPFGRWLRASNTPLEGITNGLSTDDKDPRDPEAAGIPAGFDPLRGDWEGKGKCRQILREHLLRNPVSVFGRLSRWQGPLYVMQGRLTAQKGVDALYDLTARALRDEPRAAFLFMAQGERRYEERMIHLARNSVGTGRFLFVNLFEESLARLVFVSGDFFLMPSEYEPCGLTDLKAQLMGTLPIVHRVGGLVKVVDGKTGFSYQKNQNGGLWATFMRTLDLWESDPDKIQALRRQAFSAAIQDFQWTRILGERYIPWLTDRVRSPILSQFLPT